MALIDMTKAELTDLAYAAGVIDSDGCITVSKGRRTNHGGYTFAVTVCVGMKTEDVPQWFLATFGGVVRTIRRNGAMSISADGRAKYFPPVFRWEIYAQDRGNFLEAIAPFLKLKRARSEAAIKLVRMHRNRGNSTKAGFAGFCPISESEGQERYDLAKFIRAENQKGNDRVVMTAKWGVN